MPNSRRLLLLYGALMVLLSVGYYLIPPARTPLILAIGAAAAAAVAVGVRRYRPVSPAPWLLIFVGVVLFDAERVVYDLLPGPAATDKPYLIVVTALHLAAATMIIIAFLRMARATAVGRDWAALLDSAIVILGVGLLASVAIAVPWWEVPALTAVRQWSRPVYVLLDVLLLAATKRLATAARRSPSLVLLVAGVIGMLAYGVLFRLGRIRGEWLWGTPIEVGMLAFYALVGAAALHPSMVLLTRMARWPSARVAAVRLALVATAALIPAVLMLTGPAIMRGERARLVGIAGAVMLGLVLARMVGAVVVLGRQIRTERVLRDAAEEFGAANDTRSVGDVVRRIGAVLFPDGGRSRVILSTMEDSAARERGQVRVGVLMVDSDLAARASARPTLELISASAALALDRVHLADQVVRYASEQYFGALVQSAADVILIVDDGDRIRYASPSARGVFGSSELGGRALPDLISPADRPAARRLLEHIRSGRSAVAAADWTIQAPSGVHALVEVSCRDLRAEESVRGLVVTMRDVTEQRRLEHELTKEALHDPLTGLANRRLFGDRVAHAVSTRDRVSAVLAIDLDDFKVINDGLGHDVGDAVLRSVGHRLSEAMGSRGLASRLGGDEFAALIPDAVDAKVVDEMAARVTDAIAEPMEIFDRVVSCRVCVGAATTADANTSQELMRHADLALYAAKAAGQGQRRHYEPAMTSAILHRLELRSSLSRAIRDEGLFLEYQPIVALDSGRTVGFEALLRWRHPTRGVLPPSVFVEAAEESGIIGQIGEWVLTTAMRAAAEWRSIVPSDPLYVSVNVSAQQFREPGFVDAVHENLVAAGLPPGRLLLEITESLLLRDDDAVWQDLRRLRQWGIRIAIDDFGTGYSALGYLRQVPLDVVKLDRVFTSAIATSARQRRLVEGIVRLTHALGLHVIAEGVETERERQVAVAVGCECGQGYLFARPMPEDLARRFLAGVANPSGAEGSGAAVPSASPEKVGTSGQALGTMHPATPDRVEKG